LASFRKGLGEIGLSEGRNLVIEFRWAEGRFDRLPAMAAELVGRPVNLLLGQAPPAALAAKAATTSIPMGLCDSLNHDLRHPNSQSANAPSSSGSKKPAKPATK